MPFLSAQQTSIWDRCRRGPRVHVVGAEGVARRVEGLPPLMAKIGHHIHFVLVGEFYAF